MPRQIGSGAHKNLHFRMYKLEMLGISLTCSSSLRGSRSWHRSSRTRMLWLWMDGHFVDISFMEGASRQDIFSIAYWPNLKRLYYLFRQQAFIECCYNSLCVVLTLLPSLSCTQGDDCQMEHVQSYNNLIKELCKFYVQGFCSKGDSCPYMHNILWLKSNNLHVFPSCNRPIQAALSVRES